LEAFIPKIISRNGDSHGYHVKIKIPAEKSKLVENVLKNHGRRIRERLERLYQSRIST